MYCLRPSGGKAAPTRDNVCVGSIAAFWSSADTYGLPLETDIVRVGRHISNATIVIGCSGFGRRGRVESDVWRRDHPHLLDHSAWHEASDLNSVTVNLRHQPDHRSTGEIRLCDQGIVWYIDPLAIKPDPVVAVLRFPVNIAQCGAVSVRATRTYLALQAVEPLLHFRS